MEPRQQPLWLRVTLNLCGPVGLGITLMGWVRPTWGLGVMGIGFLYVLWEFTPRINSFVRRRLFVSLVVFVLVGAGLGAVAWQIWRNIANKGAEPTVANVQQPQRQLTPEGPTKISRSGHAPLDKTLPLIVKVGIYGDGIMRVTNKGKTPINDIQLDFSSQTMDTDHPPPGQEESAVPTVKRSSFMSRPISLLEGTLDPGKSLQFDLTKSVPWNALPDTAEAMKTIKNEELDGIFRTFFVFRLTFRDARTEEKYVCFKIHSSFLKYPSAVDDNVASSQTPSLTRFYIRMTEAAFAAAKDHYRDGAKDLQCEN